MEVSGVWVVAGVSDVVVGSVDVAAAAVVEVASTAAHDELA